MNQVNPFPSEADFFILNGSIKMGIQDFLSSGNIRLDQQLKFVAEVDKMTGILRRTLLINKSRRENDAEHSWHIALMCLLFEEYALHLK